MSKQYSEIIAKVLEMKAIMKSRKCGYAPWNNRWAKRMDKKKPRYFCPNCHHLFYTGKFWRNDDDMYDDVCPNCGCYPTLNFEELAKEYIEMTKELYEKEKK